MAKKEDNKMPNPMTMIGCEHEGDKAHKGCCGDGMCCMDMAGGCCGGGCACGTGMMPEKHHGGKGGKALLALSASIFLLLSAIWVGMQVFGTPWYKNIRAEFTSAPYNRTITVEGEGKISAKPDLARVSLSVVSTGVSVKEVTDDGNKKMSAVVDAVKGLGVKPEDVQTTAYYLNPQYDYNQPVIYDDRTGAATTAPAKEPKIIGYNLVQTIDVKVRDLTKTEDVIDKSTTLGANQIGSLVFDIDDTSTVKTQAREIAFKKAREKAENMAKAAGVRLGSVITFSEGYSGFPPTYANFAVKAMDAGMAESSAPSMEPGSKELNISVSVTYEIE
ncbi:SIMPL domain-containing protein [Candidatus Peregrinibacteria bacterium]|nr:SIMPL domain-containing protein [Candidatus Peregrinibacteria bacterium]